LKKFLTASWRDLALLNWRVQPEILAQYVPRGTELDNWNGGYYVTLVGFRFLDTRVLGLPVPFHGDFQEVNLRTYVRRTAGQEVHRGVRFLQELVSSPVIATGARVTFNEPYRVVDMDRRVNSGEPGEPVASVEYRWRWKTEWCGLAVTLKGSATPPAANSEEEFITYKRWGFTPQRDGGTIEYHVEHPNWNVWQVADARVYGSVGESDGPMWSTIFGSRPHSVFFADGSPITIYRPARI
jgi:uncharacterized protein